MKNSNVTTFTRAVENNMEDQEEQEVQEGKEEIKDNLILFLTKNKIIIILMIIISKMKLTINYLTLNKIMEGMGKLENAEFKEKTESNSLSQ